MPSNENDDHSRGRAPTGLSSPARLFEFKPLALVAGIAVLGFTFAVLTEAVFDGELRAFDEWLLLALREPGNLSDPIGPLWFEEAVRDVTALGSTVVLTLAVTVVACFLWIRGRFEKAAFLVAAVVLGSLLNRALKFGFARPRPDLVAHSAHVTTESFPSGHSANSAIIYLLLGMMLARVESSYASKVFIFSICVLLTLMVGLSRIYLGVHWPTDVLAGWTVGATWALLCWYALLRLQPTGTRR